MIDPTPNNSYKTKKNFTGFYTEVTPTFVPVYNDKSPALSK